MFSKDHGKSEQPLTQIQPLDPRDPDPPGLQNSLHQNVSGHQLGGVCELYTVRNVNNAKFATLTTSIYYYGSFHINFQIIINGCDCVSL